MSRIIRQVYLSPEGIDLDYITDTDVRAQGEVYQSHHISIARGGQMGEVITEVDTALDLLLEAALALWATTPACDPTNPTEEEEEEDPDEYH